MVKDLIGQRFGRLVVLERANKPSTIKGGGAYWLCKCDCGNKKIVSGCKLRGDRVKSCGCLAKELSSERQLDNLVGQRFGRLVVEGREENKGSEVCWKCKCDCGKTCVVRAGDLKRGNTKSCGCIRVDNISGQRFGKLTVVSEHGRNSWGDVQWLCLCDCGSQTVVTTTHLRQGKVKSCGCFKTEMMIGENNPNYNPNLTQKDREDRRCQQGYKEWEQQVKKQANYTCDCCGRRGGDLHSHHLESYNSNEELRLVVTNGVCLCKKCHLSFHKKYGYGYNNIEQYKEFKGDVRMKVNERYAHYTIDIVEIVELDYANNQSHVRVYKSSGVEFENTYSLEVGINLINSGDDFRRIEVE